MTRSVARARTALGLAALLAASATVAAPIGPGFDLSWHTVDGGGGTFSVGGGFTLGGTIGQPDAGPVMTGGAFTLVGGFWSLAASGAGIPCTGDLNGDGQVNGADLGLLLADWGGSGPGDLTGNGVVDGADLGILLGAWGPCP
ncbi:MAG: hypothetical protein KDA22_12380 [Phycisphaerales bacterium]|nr:hypothetical protein [Phycisphaerales bacterium]